MSLQVSSTLSVSREKKLDCQKMAQFLSRLGIVTSVSSNISTQPGKEYGCQLVQSISSKCQMVHLWESLRNKYGFECAHLTVGNSFDGCVLDYLAPSKCKGVKVSSVKATEIVPA